MTVNFGIKAEGTKIETADIAIEGLDGMRPVLTCKPATEDNPAYFNAMSRRLRRGRRGQGDMTVKDVRKIRRDNIDLLPEHCIIGWRDVFDADGKPVEYSIDNVREFLQAIHDGAREAFDSFVVDIASPDVFTEFDDPEDVEAQAGN